MKKLNKIILLIIISIISQLNNFVYADTTLNCQNTLYYQDEGTQVKILQKNLNQTMNCNLEVDGSFGDQTYKCVTNFQKKYNLLIDGIVGIETCSKLNSLIQKKSTSNNNNYIIVSASQLNVRSRATKYSKILSTVNSGTILKTYGSKKNGKTTWYKIKINKKYGYVSGNYVEKNAIVLNITKQNLKLYENGKLVMNVPVITGNEGNHDTPTGHYILEVENMQKSQVLRGYNDDGSKYNAYVDYWMPFITSRGIGFHDASWRNYEEYNSETYLYDGSHGCVNMQPQDAMILYNEITQDTDVFVIE